MDLRDFVVTPVLIAIIYGAAFFIRPYVCDTWNYRYFYPALTLKILGAIAVGLIYQFYYSGGDTFNFHTHGSRVIWDAFWDSPWKGLKMMFAGGVHGGSYYTYSRQIYFFSDRPSFFVIRLAAIFDLLTYSTYTATACLFAVLSFAGSWMMFLTFYRKYPPLHFWIALSVLFIPSVIFWGSGLLKDTVVLACLGVLTYSFDQVFNQRKFKLWNILLLVICLYAIFIIRKFVLQAFIPAAILWIYYGKLMAVRSAVFKFLILPIVFIFIGFFSYYFFVRIGEGDTRYAVENLAETARTTAYDIAYYSGKGAGSTYSLGELDGTFGGMFRLAPAAINVALFRPYLWEVRNPLMVLSALESFVFLGLTIYLILYRRELIVNSFRNQDFIFAFVFSIIFAFAAGLASYNFGTLARYKIILLPYFSIAICLTAFSNKERKLEELESTE